MQGFDQKVGLFRFSLECDVLSPITLPTKAVVQSAMILGGKTCLRLQLKTEPADFFMKRFPNEWS